MIHLTEISQERAKEELGETVEKIQTTPDLLRDNLKEKAALQEYEDISKDLLQCLEQSDLHLLRFLRTRKYNIEAAAHNVVGWYRWLQIQQNLPTDMIKTALKSDDGDDKETLTSSENYENHIENLSYWDLKAKDVKSILDANVIFLLPGYANDGSKILAITDITKMIDLMKNQPIKHVMLGMNYLLEQASLDPNTQICGLSIVYNMENYSISILKELMKRRDFMELQKKKAAAMNDAYPFRFGEMWMFNAPWYFRFVWSIIRVFFKKKLRQRIHLLSMTNESELAKLHTAIPQSSLPKCFDGDLSNEDLFASNQAWIEERVKLEGREEIG